jgi:hypothetical protein
LRVLRVDQVEHVVGVEFEAGAVADLDGVEGDQAAFAGVERFADREAVEDAVEHLVGDVVHWMCWSCSRRKSAARWSAVLSLAASTPQVALVTPVRRCWNVLCTWSSRNSSL